MSTIYFDHINEYKTKSTFFDQDQVGWVTSEELVGGRGRATVNQNQVEQQIFTAMVPLQPTNSPSHDHQQTSLKLPTPPDLCEKTLISSNIH